MVVRVNVNGEWREADGWPGASLLALLRDGFGLTGSKNACEQGECGSCSVWLDGDLVCACLVLAAQAHDRHVRTVEGDEARMSAVQDAFVEAGAVQCGFCTPGFVVAVTDLLAHTVQPNEVEVREALSGNICRCTGYAKILDAVYLAASRMRPSRATPHPNPPHAAAGTQARGEVPPLDAAAGTQARGEVPPLDKAEGPQEGEGELLP